MSRPSTEPRDVAQPEDVVRWHEDEVAYLEKTLSGVDASIAEHYGKEVSDLEARAAFHRGAAASLRQLMEENERLKEALNNAGMAARMIHEKAGGWSDTDEFEDLLWALVDCHNLAGGASFAARRALSPVLESEHKP